LGFSFILGSSKNDTHAATLRDCLQASEYACCRFAKKNRKSTPLRCDTRVTCSPFECQSGGSSFRVGARSRTELRSGEQLAHEARLGLPGSKRRDVPTSACPLRLRAPSQLERNSKPRPCSTALDVRDWSC